MLKHVQATAGGGPLSGSRRHQIAKSPGGSVGDSVWRSSSQLEIPTMIYPERPLSVTSRASSFSSLASDSRLTPIKVYASCLRSDIEYKTLGVSHNTTSTEVIWMLLSKYKMRHRDPKLFYLTMEIDFGGESVDSRTLCLDDDARPAELRLCYPKGDCKFNLQMRKGGLIRVYDSVLMPESNYKCLLVSDYTTVAEVINILFHCYGLERIERVNRYCMLEVKNDDLDSGRKLQPDDCPAVLQIKWTLPDNFKWILQRETITSQPSMMFSTLSDGIEAMSTTSSSCSSSGTVSERSLSSCDEIADYSVNFMINGKPNRIGQTFTRTDSNLHRNSSTIAPSCLQPHNIHIEFNPPRSLPSIMPPRRTLPPPTERRPPKPEFNLNCAINNSSRPLTFAQPSYTSLTSIHESGLPTRSYQPRYLMNRDPDHSLVWLTPGTRQPLLAFRDYENYFYI